MTNFLLGFAFGIIVGVVALSVIAWTLSKKS